MLLRSFGREDIDELHDLWTAPEVRRYLWDDVVISRDTVVQIVGSHLVAASHAGPDDGSFVKQLVESGANVNAADNDGETPLMAAAELGHLAKVRFLLAHGARPNARDNMGRTALDYGRPPRNKNDDEFPQCYDSIDSSRRKTNDCEATRDALRSALRVGRKQ
jgi:hypothetical protein